MTRSEMKFAILRIVRRLGGFAVARYLTRHRLRIITWHGLALADEHEFRGGLFMSEPTFSARLRSLAEGGYPVLGLDDALERLTSGRLPPGATVLTIDDGWVGTATRMAPLLAQAGFPSTLYVASYYMQKGTAVFNVAIDYVLWKTTSEALDMSRLATTFALPDDLSTARFELDDPHQRERATTALWAFADELPDSAARQRLLLAICKVLDVDATTIERQRLFGYMTASEARELSAQGMDIQLHTHRHRFSGLSDAHVIRELDDNRAAMAHLSDRPLVHFCYPSGDYDPAQIPLLRSQGVISATTTRAGFNRAGADVMQLKRFLDSETVPEVEFEAELSGFYEIMRTLRLR